MRERATVFNLLNNLSTEHENISWKMKCLYCDGKGTTMNQIVIISLPENINIGTLVYQVETRIVSFCEYKKLQKSDPENIIDMLLDIINYSKGKTII
jgi:hypothetical protein